MRRCATPTLALATAALLSASLAAVVLNLDADRRPARGPDRAVLGAATAATVDRCADILVLGVDGAGERPQAVEDPAAVTFGPTTGAVVAAYVALADAGDRSVELARIAIDAPRAVRLVEDPGTSAPAREALTRARVRAWRAGIPDGVSAAVALLDRAATSCPDQQIVLTGYAQGAAVAHRVLLRLESGPKGLARLAGAVLVADPERRANSHVGHLVGQPAAPGAAPGSFPLVGRAAADVPADTPTFQVWQVCSRSDLLCNPRRTSVRDALVASRSYRRPPAAPILADAAAGLWRSTSVVPLPRPEVRVVTARTGVPVDVQLDVTVADDVADGVVWVDPVQLPPGLVLEESGRLSGTATETGTWNLTYAVRNTSPATRAVTGVVVVTIQGATEAVSAGGQTSCEVRSDHTLHCWGANAFGQLGDRSRQRRTTPVQVGRATDWDAVQPSGATTCGLRLDHTLWCWGLDNFGQLGIKPGPPQQRPVQVGTASDWAEVSTSWFHTCGIRLTGTLWCWGLNDRGQLGDGTLRLRGRPVRVGTESDWTSVTTGGWHTCATRSDHTAWCWGQNVFGQLGNDDPEIAMVPGQVGTDQTWLQLSAGWGHTCGLTTAGAANCWGFNDHGQLGDGSRRVRRSPEPVSGEHIWTSLSTGDASSCGVDNTGAAYCWGSNRYGQLAGRGRGDQVEPGLVSVAGPWLSVDVGWLHACGGLASGVSACWGNNEAGQVGNGNTSDRAQPQEVS